MDLHRDICDKIIFKKDGKEYRRIPEVLDVWMDSGSVPFAEYHYPFEKNAGKDTDSFNPERPADFIIEYVGQVRAWFNVLLRVSTLLFDNNAFLKHNQLINPIGAVAIFTFGNILSRYKTSPVMMRSAIKAMARLS